MENTLKTKKSIKPWTWILFLLTVPSLLLWAFTDSNVIGYLNFWNFRYILSFLPHPGDFYHLLSLWTGVMALLFTAAVFCAFMRWRIPVVVISVFNVVLFSVPILISLCFGGTSVLILSDITYILICLLIHVALILLCFVEVPAVRIIAAIAFILLGILAIAGTIVLGAFRFEVRNGLRYESFAYYQRYLIDNKLFLIDSLRSYFRNGAPISHIINYCLHLLCLPPLTACVQLVQRNVMWGSNFFPVSMGMFLVTAGTAFLGLPRLKKVNVTPVAAEPQFAPAYTENFQPEFIPVEEPVAEPVEEPVEEIQPVAEPQEIPTQQPQANSLRDNLQNIALLKELLDAGAITQEEFETKKAELLKL